MGRDSSVGITTRYELDGPGIDSGVDEISARVQTEPKAHPTSYAIVSGSFSGVRRPGRGVDHPPPYRAEVKESVELILYSLFGSSWIPLG